MGIFKTPQTPGLTDAEFLIVIVILIALYFILL